MTIFRVILLVLLIVCALAACLTKKLLNSIVIFMSFSLIMCTLWFLLESPDLAITEAAVGAGIDTILFFLVLHKVNQLDVYHDSEEDKKKTKVMKVTKDE